MSKEKYIPCPKIAEVTPAEFIRMTCELKEITQTEFARQAGLHPSHLSEIVHGKRPIGATVAKRLAKAIGISVARLLEDYDYEAERKKNVEAALKRALRHIKASQSLEENTERILLKDIEDAMEANREAS